LNLFCHSWQFMGRATEHSQAIAVKHAWSQGVWVAPKGFVTPDNDARRDAGSLLNLHDIAQFAGGTTDLGWRPLGQIGSASSEFQFLCQICMRDS
jgi:hypothetical protein